MIYDVIIIGAGVTGAAVARELSRYDAEVCVLEKGEDVCSGTSKANSAIVHAGYDCQPGSLMAKMNVRGNEMMGDLACDLDIPFERSVSFERDIQITGEVMAEHANVNGVDFRFNTAAEKLTRDEDGIWHIRTNNGEYKTRAIVNAAGVYSDVFHNMVADRKIHITPRRGDYMLLDKTVGGHVKRTIFPQPTKYGKGILIAPTIHGNLFIGPTAIDLDDKEATATTQEGLTQLIERGETCVKNVPYRSVITSFGGLRAHEDGHEFVLGEVAEAPGFFDCAAIESPGLTSSPAIGEYTAGIISDKYGFKKKENWIPTIKNVLKPANLSIEERNELIKKEPAYGRIICRCESISEGEILDAIRRPLGARSRFSFCRRTPAV